MEEKGGERVERKCVKGREKTRRVKNLSSTPGLEPRTSHMLVLQPQAELEQLVP